MLDKLVFSEVISSERSQQPGMKHKRTPYLCRWLGCHICDHDVRARVKEHSDEASTEPS